MNIATWMFLFLNMLILASCQVKETAGSGALISGHKEVSNVFSINTPAADILVSGDTMNLSLSFPFPVTVDTVGGTPSLSVIIGGATRAATYSSGSGSKVINFSYTIVPADNDLDGITVGSLSLNGGLLQFNLNGVITNCVTTLTSATFSQLTVDNTAPTINAFTLANVPGFYHLGDLLNFTMTYSEAVYVTGAPRFAIALTTGGTVNVSYAGGSGTSTLAFTYTITNADADTDSITITSPIALNGGTILDSAGNASSLDFSAFVAAAQTYSATVLFSGRIPYSTSVIPPTSGTYVAAQNLDVTVNFDRAVTVSGSPYIGITVGSTLRQAVYFSGTGTSALVFRYTTVPGDVDTDGITIATTITQNGGSITGTAAPTGSFFNPPQNNLLTIPNTAGVIVGATQPAPTSVTRNVDSTTAVWGTALDNYWIVGQQLLITVAFNTGIYVNQTSGTPRIPITIGATTKYATYLSGGDGQTSLVFTYTVVDGDLDTDGSIAIGSIDLNGGTMTDSAATNSTLTLPVTSLTTTYIDGIRPTISSIAAPANGPYSDVTASRTNFTFNVTWSEPVDYSSTTAAAAYVPLTIGGSAVNATYVSGNRTATVVHRPSSLAGLTDTDGITMNSPFAGSATFRDQAGNSVNTFTYTPPVTTGVLVDTTAPTITSVTSDQVDGWYNGGQNLDFTVTFNESVTVTKAGAYPRIQTTIGATTYYLVASATATGATHTFSLTLQNTDNDTNGIGLFNTVELNTATIQDAALNDSGLTFTIPNTAGILVNGILPTPQTVTPPANGVYASDGTPSLDFTIAYDENISVTGTPRITANGFNFDYVSGTGTSTLTFRYTLTSSDLALGGLSTVSAIGLNGGTLTDPQGQSISTNIGSQDLSQVFLKFPEIAVWQIHATAGVATTEACGTATCRTYSGDDSLSIAALTAHTIFVAFKTPTAFIGNIDLISPDIALNDDTTNFDLFTANGNLDVDGTPFSGVNHAANLLPGTTHLIQFDYTTPAAISGAIVPTTFNGAIGEVIILNAAIAPADKTRILNYLNAKY